MNNIWRVGIFMSMVVMSGHLAAQSSEPGMRMEPIYPVIDSLSTTKLTTARTSSNRLKVNPFSLLLGQLSLFYERALSPRTSLVVGYGTGGNIDNFGSQLEPGGATYQRVTLEGRRYWTNHRWTNFYAGPYLRVSRLTVSEFIYDPQGQVLRDSQGIRLTTNERATIWIPGLMVGGQLIKKWFCLDGFFGIQRQVVVGTPARGNQLVEAMTADWATRIGLTVGVAF